MSEVRERPIIFNGWSIKAILEERKTQTRRVVKPVPVLDVGVDSRIRVLNVDLADWSFINSIGPLEIQ